REVPRIRSSSDSRDRPFAGESPFPSRSRDRPFAGESPFPSRRLIRLSPIHSFCKANYVECSVGSPSHERIAACDADGASNENPIFDLDDDSFIAAKGDDAQAIAGISLASRPHEGDNREDSSLRFCPTTLPPSPSSTSSSTPLARRF